MKKLPVTSHRSQVIGLKLVSCVLCLVTSLCLELLILTGCSAQSKNKFLRTFFDGVPLVEQEQEKVLLSVESKVKGQRLKVKEIGENSNNLSKEPLIFSHAPFAQKQCDSCHDKKSSQKMSEKGNKLCFSCHDDFTKKKIVHYPISDGACLDCHDPHEAPNKFMLKEAVPKLCFPCHDQKYLAVNPAHEGVENCMGCHNPHASDSEKLLK